jgi:hypothetical protein
MNHGRVVKILYCKLKGRKEEEEDGWEDLD